MKHKLTKAIVCAVAAAILISGTGYRTEAARGVAATLPAAGLGLTLGEGTSIAVIREDVKQKKLVQQDGQQQQEIQKEMEQGTEASSEQETETATVPEALPQETESGTESTLPAQSSSQETVPVKVPETESIEQDDSSVSGNEAESETEPEIVEALEPVDKEPEARAALKAKEPELIIAQVNNYVNIRSTPSTDGEVVGKLYDNSVGTLISEEDGWYQIKSGSVEGYVKAEYCKRGDDAKRIADEVGDKIATVTTQTLKVRTEPSLEASVLGLVPGGEELTVMDTAEGFVKVSIEEGDGWVSTDYVDVEVEYVTAESREEEAKRLAAEEAAKEEAKKAAAAAEAKLREEKKKEEEAKKRAEQEAAAANEAAAAQEQSGDSGSSASTAQQSTPEPVTVTPSSNSGLGQAVANYAVQFVGNPYVYGGTSLTNGADCSGFVMSVYKHFGVSLPHSSTADRSVGYKVNSMAEAQPGDILCYSGHVAIYIGNGKIVHASTKATGIKISDASYRKPLAIRRIF